jgi:hypothetical protein
MHRFAARGSALASKPGELLIRLVMLALPVVTFSREGVAVSVILAVFLGIIDGYVRLWACFTARSFVADTEGLEINCGFATHVVSWVNVSAIQTWHHFNRMDYVAIHYFRAGRVEVATCLARYAEDELRAFARAAAHHVSCSQSRLSLTIAGLRERSIYAPLLKRLAQDVALTTLLGVVIGPLSVAFAVGLLSASSSTLLAAARHSLHTTTVVREGALWCPEGRPLRIIPAALRLWIRCLAELT